MNILIEGKVSIDSTIIKFKKKNITIILFTNVISPFRTKFTRKLYSSLDQPTITQTNNQPTTNQALTNNNNNNKPRPLLCEQMTKSPLSCKCDNGQMLPLTGLLNGNILKQVRRIDGASREKMEKLINCSFHGMTIFNF